MRKLVLMIFALLGFLAQALAAEPNPGPSAEFNTLLAPVKTMTANFEQQTFDNNNDLLVTSKGRMALKKPEKFLWQTTSPNKQILVTDQNGLKIYDEDLQQLTIQPLDLKNTVNPAQLLSGNTAQILKHFTVKKQPGLSFRLTPENKQSQFQWLEFNFNNDKKLTSMRVFNQLGQLVVIRFQNVILNQALPDSTFQLKYPRGTAVVDNSN